MTPIKTIADAAREVLDYAKRNSIGAGDWVEATLADALASYDAAQVSQPPTDAELESAIDAYRDSCYAHARAATFGEDDDEPSTAQAADAARKALSSLMRSRPDAGLLPPGSILPSAPLVPPHDGLLRAAKAVLAVDVLMRNAQNGMPAHVFNGVLEVLQEEAIPDLRAEVARLEGK